jgi:hypothetical protein
MNTKGRLLCAVGFHDFRVIGQRRERREKWRIAWGESCQGKATRIRTEKCSRCGKLK